MLPACLPVVGRVNPPSANPLCGQCVEGLYLWGDSCVECTNSRYGYMFLLLLLLLALITLVYALNVSPDPFSPGFPHVKVRLVSVELTFPKHHLP